MRRFTSLYIPFESSAKSLPAPSTLKPRNKVKIKNNQALFNKHFSPPVQSLINPRERDISDFTDTYHEITLRLRVKHSPLTSILAQHIFSLDLTPLESETTPLILEENE